MLPWKQWVPAPADLCFLKNIPQHVNRRQPSEVEDWERFGLDCTFKYHQKMADVTIQCWCECLMYGYVYIYQVWDDPNQAHAGGWYTNRNHHLLGEVSIYVRECARIYPSQKKQAKESLLLYRNGQWAVELQYSVYRYRITLKYLDAFGQPPDTAIFQRSFFRVATSKT